MDVSGMIILGCVVVVVTMMFILHTRLPPEE
jgi:hypothetical protein